MPAGMSALGQKQTCAAQQALSELYHRKRTCAVHQLMSALGQKRTSPQDRLIQLVALRFHAANDSRRLARAVRYINSPKRRRHCSSSISSIDSAPSRIAALNSSLSEAHSLGLASKRTYTLLAAACCSAPSRWNWSFMSERICCVVASPKTESRSAAAVAVIANTTMSGSVKSTVSIMDLHTLILSHEAGANYCSNLSPWLK